MTLLTRVFLCACVPDEKNENSHLSFQVFLKKIHCSQRVCQSYLTFRALLFFFRKCCCTLNGQPTGYFAELLFFWYLIIALPFLWDSKHSLRVIFYIIYVIRKATGYNGAVMTHWTKDNHSSAVNTQSLFWQWNAVLSSVVLIMHKFLLNHLLSFYHCFPNIYQLDLSHTSEGRSVSMNMPANVFPRNCERCSI